MDPFNFDTVEETNGCTPLLRVDSSRVVLVVERSEGLVKVQYSDDSGLHVGWVPNAFFHPLKDWVDMHAKTLPITPISPFTRGVSVQRSRRRRLPSADTAILAVSGPRQVFGDNEYSAIMEIIATEKTYHEELSTIVNLFLEPLSKEGQLHHFLSLQERELLFANIRILLVLCEV